ncbi:Uncharacterised protein [Mycoplasmopsis californica]|uniref:Lipoprotein-associated type-17 domain-containing protein n=1 Tax=Mycoplasmopsis equigenitalium TaxID=114883 RepID=A0ABY5J5N4_9BACT|nr:lipoprotein 17-related variable surface protein [Mycoplasmopsis equigenitalium]UUD37191.1 hypothetical protein NPA09_01290 [Mycoplasmopsis equigenitalium]VEU69504.1 Uncharacterised protein [Mycoplasmopsis californica]
MSKKEHNQNADSHTENKDLQLTQNSNPNQLTPQPTQTTNLPEYYTQYNQQPTSIHPQQIANARRPLNVKNIVGALIAVAAPVIVSVGTIAVLLNVAKKQQESKSDIQQMKTTLRSLSLDVENKESKSVIDVSYDNLQLIGSVPSDYTVSYDIINIDKNNNKLTACIFLIDKNGHTEVSDEITITGFKAPDWNNKELIALIGAVSSLRGNLNAIRKIPLNKNKVVTLNNKDKVVTNVLYPELSDLAADTGLPLTELANSDPTLGSIPIELTFSYTPFLRPGTQEVDAMEVTLNLTCDQESASVKFIIEGYLPQSVKDSQTLDEAFAGLGKSFLTSNYKAKTTEEVIASDYLNVENIFQDIHFDFASLKSKIPESSFDTPTFELKSNDSIDVSIVAKLRKTTKNIKFNVEGFAPLQFSHQKELENVALEIANSTVTRQNTNKLPSLHKYVDYIDFFNDVDWHFDDEAKKKNISFTLESQAPNDTRGEKLLVLVLSKQKAKLRKNITVTGFMDENAWAEYAFSQIFREMDEYHFNTKHVNNEASEVTFDTIQKLATDTGYDFEAKTQPYKVNLRVVHEVNDGVYYERGEKLVTIEAEFNNITKTKDIIVHGFLTKNNIDRRNLMHFVNEVGKETVTKNHTDKGVSSPASAYANFDDFTADVAVPIKTIMLNYQGLTVKDYTLLANGDGVRTVSFIAQIGNETELITMKIKGFLSDAASLNKDIAAIKAAINDEYQTTLYNDDVASATYDKYNVIGDLDNDCKTSLVDLASQYGATITIKQRLNNDPLGYVKVTLNINLRGTDYEEIFLIKGFLTSAQWRLKILNEAKAKIKSSYTTSMYKDLIPSTDPSAAIYKTITELENDIKVSFAALVPRIDVSFASATHTYSSLSGYVQCDLKLSFHGESIVHRITVTGFLTKKVALKRMVDNLINKLPNEVTTKNNIDKHASIVPYQTRDALKNDTPIDLAALEASHEVLINMQKVATVGDKKEITLLIKSKEDPTIFAEKIINITGYLTAKQFEEKVLVQELITQWGSESVEIIRAYSNLPSMIRFTDFDLTMSFCKPKPSKLQQLARQITSKYKIHDNTRDFTFAIDETVGNENDDENGTKKIYILITYGNLQKRVPLVITNFCSHKWKKKMIDGLNYWKNTRKLKFVLLNNGLEQDGSYHQNDPDKVKNEDIVLRSEDGASLPAPYKIRETIRKNFDDYIEIKYKLMAEENGKWYIEDTQAIQKIYTANPQTVINRVFDATDFGYMIRSEHAEFRMHPADTKVVINCSSPGTLTARDLQREVDNSGKPDTVNKWSQMQYFEKPQYPTGLTNVKITLARIDGMISTVDEEHNIGHKRWLVVKKPTNGVIERSIHCYSQNLAKHPALKYIFKDLVLYHEKYSHISIPLTHLPAQIQTYSSAINKKTGTTFTHNLVIQIEYTYYGKVYYKNITSAEAAIYIPEDDNTDAYFPAPTPVEQYPDQSTGELGNGTICYIFDFSKANKAVVRKDGKAI